MGNQNDKIAEDAPSDVPIPAWLTNANKKLSKGDKNVLKWLKALEDEDKGKQIGRVSREAVADTLEVLGSLDMVYTFIDSHLGTGKKLQKGKGDKSQKDELKAKMKEVEQLRDDIVEQVERIKLDIDRDSGPTKHLQRLKDAQRAVESWETRMKTLQPQIQALYEKNKDTAATGKLFKETYANVRKHYSDNKKIYGTELGLVHLYISAACFCCVFLSRVNVSVACVDKLSEIS